MRNEIQTRNVGIEILRIISMFLIATSHVCTQGGILETIKPFTVNYVVVWIIMCIAYCATNCYALISGYIGVDAKFGYYRIAVLWIRVVFYTLLITIIFGLTKSETVGIMDFVNALTPATSGPYWYFSAYFALFFFMPFLNFLLNKLSRKQLTVLVFTMVIIFSLLPTLRHTDTFVTGEGYSTLWLIVLYVIGGWLKKTQLLYRFKKRVWFGVWTIMVFIAIFSKLVVEYVCWNVVGKIAGGGYLISYVSPIILLEAIALLGIFVQVKTKHTKLIIKSASLVFSVYIIHEHTFLKEEFLRGSFSHYVEFGPIKLVLSIIGTALTILIVCTLIDYVRERLFVALKVTPRIKNALGKLQEKISTKWEEWKKEKR